MRRFSLHRRGDVFYAQLRNPNTGGFLPARSTRCTNRDDAVLVVNDWLQNGVPEPRTGRRRSLSTLFDIDTILETIRNDELTAEDVRRVVEELTARGFLEDARLAGQGESAEPLLGFLERFWDYDESPYVREKLAYGQSIGRRHCYEQTKRLHHYREYFGADTRLCDLTRAQLKEFQLWLKDKELTAKTVNSTLSVATVALSWAAEQGIIAQNPAEGLRKFSGAAKRRGVLTPEQAAKLFRIEWADERARVGSLVAMTTGLRAGEIVALRFEDIGLDRLFVRHSWSFADGLKTPKNGETREVPLLPEVRKALLGLAGENPHGPRAFIFYHADADRPCDPEILRKGLQAALVDMSLSEADRTNETKRKEVHRAWIDAGVAFHSWRHFYAQHMADHVDMRSVQLATGHKTAAMAEHYAGHKTAEHFDAVRKAAADVFAGVVELSPKSA